MIKDKGFTIIELIITVSLFATLFILGSTMLTDVLFGSKQQFLAMTNIDQSVVVASKFTNDLRNATNGSDGSFPLYLAESNQIIFYSNSNASNPLRIRYYLSDNKLYRGVITPTGSPLSYNLAQEVITMVQSDVVNNTEPVFTYFDGNYSGSEDPLVQPVNINDVKYIKMNLVILKQNQSQSQSTFSVTAGGVIRNLKNNLGN